MAEITITIPDEKVDRVKDALIGLYPIPLAPSEEEGSEGEMIPQYTENQWSKQCVINFLKRSVARFEQKQARDAIAYSEDNELAS